MKKNPEKIEKKQTNGKIPENNSGFSGFQFAKTVDKFQEKSFQTLMSCYISYDIYTLQQHFLFNIQNFDLIGVLLYSTMCMYSN